MMNDHGKSDRSVVLEKPPNKADHHAAEVAEGRDRAKGNPAKRDKPWTLSQPGLPSALERVGQAARQDRKRRFTALLHHIYDVGRLRKAYHADRKSTRLNSSHANISYAVFCLKKKKTPNGHSGT